MAVASGRAVFEVKPSIQPRIGKLNAISGVFAIGAAMLSKTSFALTLLRVLFGRLRPLLWFIVVSMNVALFLSVLFVLIQCKPVEKGWNPTIPGSCWPASVAVHFGLFSSSR